MKKKKLLIIDNDIIARRAVAKVLNEWSDCELYISGDTGSAEQQIIRHNPDLLLLGIRSSVAEELALLSTVRIRFPHLPVILLTERSEEGAAVAIAGLRLGAVDFITKPKNNNNLLFAERHLVKRLLPILKILFSLNQSGDGKIRRNPLSSYKMEFDPLESVWPLSLVVVGGCTGGPSALFTMVPKLSEDLAIPMVIALHFPKNYTKLLSEKLNEVSRLEVLEATDGVALEPGTVWIAPGGYHSEVQRDGNRTLLKVHRGPRENGFRPSIDILFRSAGRLYGPGVLGVVLSGCGQDGVQGAGVIQQAGGQIVVQHPRSATVAEMPLSLIRAGYCDGAYPKEEIADRLAARVQSQWPSESEELQDRPAAGLQYPNIWRAEKHLFSTLS